MNKNILILSSIYDFSTDLVTQRLEEAGEEYFRLNKEHFHLYDIALDPINATLNIEGKDFVFSTESIKSIWYRQPVFLRNTPGKKINIEEQLSKSQWSAFLRGLMVFDNSFWMNWPQSTYAAESKPYQLRLASRMGFSVPETIINNGLGYRKIKSKNFIIKSLDTILLKENNDCYFTYTSKATPDDFTVETTRESPITFQEYIEEKLDIRVTVIGEKVFSVSITSNDNPISGDWRLINKEGLEYNDITLPEKIKNLCISYTKKLGLSYGAIDLIKSHNKYFFIEINPTGEWGWLCNSKREIDNEIAKKLIFGKTKK
ncbi:hypothetical protein MJO48_16305 [Dickeya fangzhongdai]|uniref:MvdC/MvdD family ATP grasp protein n=1 Tax=Dickeya fangzhongdai TaxID=1778540 RepID=UPI001EFA7E74|nr:hypothetical protein [Dickeya fangzhongdai]ULR30029.1 hypothetical protein MJO48_16305 [Dickeya fangzhongdai]